MASRNWCMLLVYAVLVVHRLLKNASSVHNPVVYS
jgi:hypothetical protein